MFIPLESIDRIQLFVELKYNHPLLFTNLQSNESIQTICLLILDFH